MNNNKLIEKPDWEMLGKYLSHETTETETEQVEKWANQSGKNREELDKIRLILEQADSVYKLKQYNSEAAWENVADKLEAAPEKKVRKMNFRKEGLKTFYKYAAVLLVALLLGTAGYFIGFQNPLQEIYATKVVANVQNANEYVLPDGSTVTLNSESKISFPKRFNGQTREVTITGEAFFDVKSNPEKPFVINAGEAKITVLGTSFNVSAYPENEKVEVVVETGRVEVSHKTNKPEEGDEKILLTRGEKGTLLEKDNILEESVNTDHNYLAWKTRNLVFEETPMNQVIGHLKKVYRIDIQIEDKEINEMVLTAEFDKKSIDFVLNVVTLTFDLDLKFENDHYTLAKQGNVNN
jgi:ferric-dicitrate binding protein FerR (iron transport regulator)